MLETQTRPNDAVAPTAPQTNTAGTPRPVSSRIDRELVFRGTLETTGAIEVEGVIDGSLAAGALQVAAEGLVKGDVKAETAVIAGRFEGVLTARFVTIAETAKVEGEIHYERLAVASGAEVEAAFRPGATVTL